MPANEILVEHHPLLPFLPENAKMLFLGSFPPQKKRWCIDFYYPNFTNDMWRVFGLVFFADANWFVDLSAKKYKKDQLVTFLQDKGIAFYDTATTIRRLQDNASDKFLEIVEPTSINTLLEQIPLCRTLVTTGEKATETACEYFQIIPPKVGEYVTFLLGNKEYCLYRMPSTSRAYPLALAKKATIYGKMFHEIFK